MSNFQNLLVIKLPRNLRDSHLLAAFTPFGASSATVMVDVVNGKSKGFGFVLFDSVDAGQAAHDALKGTKVFIPDLRLSFRIDVYPSRHDGTTARPSKVLYIRNIPSAMSQQQIHELVTTYGCVVELLLRPDRHDFSKLTVAVEFDCVSCATAALGALHRTLPPGSRTATPILAKFADRELPRHRFHFFAPSSTPTAGSTPQEEGASNLPPTSLEKEVTDVGDAAPRAGEPIAPLPVDGFVETPFAPSTSPTTHERSLSKRYHRPANAFYVHNPYMLSSLR